MDFKTLSYRVFHFPRYFIAFGFGSGLLPVAPGTFGTLAAIPLYVLLTYLSWPIYVLLLVGFFLIGVWITDSVSKELKVHDFSGIVWDECVGYWITMLLVPRNWMWMCIGFFLFRLFDIWKPWPINIVDKQVKGGLGIMLDDVLAGLLACITLHLIIFGVHKL